MKSSKRQSRRHKHYRTFASWARAFREQLDQAGSERLREIPAGGRKTVVVPVKVSLTYRLRDDGGGGILCCRCYKFPPSKIIICVGTCCPE
jgi:hypothetical protein